jgi:hypothetical protein
MSTSQRTQSPSITKTSRPIPFREITYIHLDNNMKPKYNVWENAAFLMNSRDAYIYYWALND